MVCFNSLFQCCFLFDFIFTNCAFEGNGVIDYNEFTDMLDKTKSNDDPEADLKEAFKVFDLDGDGVITVRI